MTPAKLARKSPPLEAAFRLYTRRYLRRSFHAVHCLGDFGPARETFPRPLLVCLNHSSWWDVLLGFFVATDVLGRDSYTVMDARQLQRYKFFARLGVIGVDRASLKGAKEFLTVSADLLRGSRRALWITAQGEMLSSAARPIRFQPGLGYLAERLGEFDFTTLVLHYEFWNERLPEAFVSLSSIECVTASGPDWNRKAFVHAQERRLEAQIDALQSLVERRDPTAFRPLLHGSGGISPTYDFIRSLNARLRGKRFSPEHSDLETPQWRQNDKPGT